MDYTLMIAIGVAALLVPIIKALVNIKRVRKDEMQLEEIQREVTSAIQERSLKEEEMLMMGKEDGELQADVCETESSMKKENSSGRTWGEVIIQSTPSFDIVYEGWLVNGEPDGHGTYSKWSMGGKEVIHDLPPGGTGYGTAYDSNGNLYTGNWIFGHTEEEFDELWHEIN